MTLAAVSTMRAAVIGAARRASVAEVEPPAVGPADVLVRIEGCGVCTSSVPLWEGRPWFDYPLAPGAPGHEGWGVVEAVGAEVDEPAPGRRVALLSGHAFAELDVAPAAHCVSLPPELAGKPVPAEALGCAVNVFRRSGVVRAERVAVVGIGFLGSLLVQLCRAGGAEVHAVRRGDTPGGAFDCVIEAAGTQDALDVASRLVAERGRLVIAGYHQDGLRTIDLQSWNWRGLDVVNAHERDPAVYVAGMREATALVAVGLLDPSPLYTHRFPLDRLDDAFEAARTRPSGFVKALVFP
jgi:threonine dehydrogenase-like Zn-dependent dehydrogenase